MSSAFPSRWFLLAVWIVRLIRRPGKAMRLARLARGLAWTASLTYLAFMLLHGLNYDRLPVGQSFALPVRERASGELKETSTWLVEQTNRLRSLTQEDEHGIFRLSQGVAETLQSVAADYTAAAADYPLLAGPEIRPKGVLLSHYWSYTGITGVYMPFFVESNVNIDVPEHTIPETALHEIAHTRGFAREDEAGFLAFLVGLYSENPDHAYSVLLGATLHSLNALYGADPEAYQLVAADLSDAVRRDLQAAGAYWKQFEGPVQEASTQINNAYLQANLQADGVRSYGADGPICCWPGMHSSPNKARLTQVSPLSDTDPDGYRCMPVLHLIGHRETLAATELLRLFFGTIREEAGSIRAGTDDTVITSRLDDLVAGVEPGQPDRVTVETALGAIRLSSQVMRTKARREIKRQLYQILSQWTGRNFPWGSLTGIRPTQVATECLAQAPGFEAARRILIEHWFVSAEKADLALETALAEQRILSRIAEEALLVYIGIPFCPSRCSYCSFITCDAPGYASLLDAYVEAVIREAERLFAAVRQPVAALYIGGGTPTSLSAVQLQRLLQGVFTAVNPIAGVQN